jgi:hypothetical protein
VVSSARRGAQNEAVHVERLFRFVLTRPAVEPGDDLPSIPLAQDSAFQQALADAAQASQPRDAVKAVAADFVAGPEFVPRPADLPVAEQLGKLRASLDQLQAGPEVSNAEVSVAIENAFGATPADLVNEQVLDPHLGALRDSILAIKYLPAAHRRDIEGLARQLRDLELTVRVALGDDFPVTGTALRRYRRRGLRLPLAGALESGLGTRAFQQGLEQQREQARAARREQAEQRLADHGRLVVAIRELTALGADQLETTVQSAIEGFMLPAEVRPVQLYINEVKTQQESGGPGISLADLPRVPGGTPTFNPQTPGEAGFRLRASAAERLSEPTRQLLDELGVSLTGRPLDQVVEILAAESEAVARELDRLLGRPASRTFRRIGEVLVSVSTPQPSAWNDIVMGAGHRTDTPYPIPEEQRVPASHGEVSPVGVADLLVVTQQLVRYEGAEVAHIENILRGEKKEREHTRRQETEELFVRETELTATEERELESTNRFEMTRETNETIRQDATLRAGLTVSGSYGPTVEFSATAEGSVSRSRERAVATASTFSQDVTERSATRITERVLEKTSLRITSEVVERNLHSLDNTSGAAHISGVYQWVSKVYQAQMFNYGQRMMFDFMVPEPGAFLVAAIQSGHTSAVDLEKPVPFTLRPDQVTEYNYHSWVHLYGATDVVPPPELYRTKSWDFTAGDGGSTTDYTHSGQVTIDEGYRAVYGTIAALKNIWENGAVVDVALGSRTHRFGLGDWMWSSTLSDERDSLPYAVKTKYVGDVALAGEVKCQRTDRALLAWKLETHAKLTTAYQARLAEYEEKLSALEVAAGVEIPGSNPQANLALMRGELRKNCVSILTAQHFDLFDAVTTGPDGLPQIDLPENEAEGPYVRFFEQAFEWEHLTWVTYPYFWGSKDSWPGRIAYADPDPVFNEFLKAGYCRVAVPVRPGFEGAVDHFLTFGEPWVGGPLPPVSSPLYLPIAEELAERAERPLEEIPEGDPWLVRIPTTLVRLRPDDQLPEWSQGEDGNWAEQ